MRKFYTGGGCVDGVAKQIVETGYGPAKLYYGVTIKADPDNDAEIYVGVAGVTSSTGFCLDKGDEIELPIDDIHSVYIIADPAHSTVQVITVNDLAAGGKFDLTFGGQTTDPIAVDAAAATVEAALEALSTIGAGNVTVAGDAGGPYTATFGGDLAKTDVETITGQAVSETQTITVTSGADPDVMVLTFGGESTAELPHDASAAEVQAALEALASVGEGNALVTSDEDAVWVVEFTGDLEDQDVGAITGVCGSDEVQTITLSATAVTDTMVLTFDSQSTAALDYDATGAEVLAALEALSNIEVDDVEVEEIEDGWQVTFTGNMARTDVAAITGVCGTSEVQTITLTDAVAGDTMVLSFDGQSTSELAYDITSANLATALKALSNIGESDVTVEDGDPDGWVITFAGDLARQPVELITGVCGTNEVQTITLTDTAAGDLMYITYEDETTSGIAYDAVPATVETALEGLTTIGAGNVSVGGSAGAWTLTFQGDLAKTDVDSVDAVCGVNETQTVRLADEAAGDHVILTLGAESTDALAYDADPSVVQAALEAFTGIGAGNVSVVAGDPDGWDCTFIGSLARTAVTNMTGVGGKYEVQTVRLTDEAAGDLVILTFDGESTGPIAYDASASTVQAALEALSNIDPGDIEVSVGDPDGWDVVFKSYTGAVDLTGVGGANEKQTVTLTGAIDGDVFTLTFDGQTTAQIAYDAGAATVQSALEGLSNIDPGDVIVTDGDPSGWVVEFTGTYAYTDAANLTGTSPQNEIQNVTVSGATGGTFTLTYGEQTTDAIAFDAVVAVVESELEALSSIGEGNVSVTAGDPAGYEIEFINDLAQQNLALITANDASLTGDTPSIAVTELVAGTALTVGVATTQVANELTVVVTETVAANEITVTVTESVAAHAATVDVAETTPGNTAAVNVVQTVAGNTAVVAVEETVAGHAASVDVVETTKGDGDATVSVVSTLSSDGCYYSWIAL